MYNWSIGQSSISGTYIKSVIDVKGMPVPRSPYRYEGITKHKLILKKNKTFLYTTIYKASEFRSHSKKGKVYNFKAISKSQYQGQWEIKNDSLILNEKQLGRLAFFHCKVKKNSYLCAATDVCPSDVIKEVPLAPCFGRRKRT
jgi:hypothetical protein